MEHRNIPIFIPHLGCPNQCVFCNQRSISGCEVFREETVTAQIEEALATIPKGTDTEIAFFGGSFTGIERSLMIRLLNIAEHYVRNGRVNAIRLSTRPDYISKEILEILSAYSVKTVELGLQSMNDGVLAKTKRGHTVRDAERACRAVVDAGFSLVGQMMIGLPDSTLEDELATAKILCELGVSAVRIYPTVVYYETELCRMVEDGSYTPLNIEEAVFRTAEVLAVFDAKHVPCIRIGLCASEGLTSSDTVMAGPNHPALGELVLGELAYRKTLEKLKCAGLLGRDVVLSVPLRELSHVIGQNKRNIERFERETGTRIRKIVGTDSADILAMPWK